MKRVDGTEYQWKKMKESSLITVGEEQQLTQEFKETAENHKNQKERQSIHEIENCNRKVKLANHYRPDQPSASQNYSYVRM